MANTPSTYDELNMYPANPYINPNTPDAAAGAGGELGWWETPKINGAAFAEGAYSPEFLQAQKNLYGWFGDLTNQVPNLAGQYQGYLEQSPLLEQTQYNQALSRLKGQYGTAMQGLATQAGAVRGGNRGGAMQFGLQDLGRQLMSGTRDIATTQAMNNLAQREERQRTLLGFMNQDWANKLGAGQAAQGWLGQMAPTEQFNIQMPYQMALDQENINAGRRNEAMGWMNNLMNWQNQQANQYYGGQGNWLNYQNMYGNAILGGYTPQWLGWTQAYM